ncbi:MAG: DoxX family protein [Chitinophagaceae bacterium]|nr:DoxX family protein [Chitinophagaceae bacterium]
MKDLFSSSPLWYTAGLTLARIITGFFMIWHGWEIFDSNIMNGYLQWDVFKQSSGKTMIYLGKAAELSAGIFLFIGLFTRIAAIILIGAMSYITFFVGHGKVWYDDQHPFLFVLLGLIFFVIGGGKWSIDYLLFKNKQR